MLHIRMIIVITNLWMVKNAFERWLEHSSQHYYTFYEHWASWWVQIMHAAGCATWLLTLETLVSSSFTLSYPSNDWSSLHLISKWSIVAWPFIGHTSAQASCATEHRQTQIQEISFTKHTNLMSESVEGYARVWHTHGEEHFLIKNVTKMRK